MEQKSKVTILSSFAEDTFIDEMNDFICRQVGGPARYIAQAFLHEGIPFDLRSASVGEVEILRKKDEELGRIVRRPDSLWVRFGEISSSFLVISTLLDEIALEGLSAFKGRVFLDVQGYVRDGRVFGKKKDWEPSADVAESLFCVKGTTEELRHIRGSFLETQKKKVLIETKNALGCEIFFREERIPIRPSRMVRDVHATGAGDMFFAFLISQYMRTGDVRESGVYAVEKTVEFLSAKSDNQPSRRKDENK